MTTRILLALSLAALLTACGERTSDEPVAAAPAAEEEPPALPRTRSPEGARVFFVSPEDGATVSNPVKVVFGIEGMSVAPAGDDTPHSGHHHIIIDAELPDLGLPIPATDNYVHFGDGRTETELHLEPGEHTLQMLLGDHMHIPHDPPLTSSKITVFVE
jgi:hypothetical protein